MRSTSPSGTLGGNFLSVALAAVGCVVTLAACGSSRSTGYHNARYPYGAPNVPASLSRCMRANGLSGFPDPVAGPGGEGLPLSVNTDGSLTAAGQTFAGPALRSAERVCKEYLPPGGPPPKPSAEQQRQALAFARCMRAHGVPNFPDPTFSGGGPAQRPLAGINPDAPAVRTAARVCGAGGRGNFEIGG